MKKKTTLWFYLLIFTNSIYATNFYVRTHGDTNSWNTITDGTVITLQENDSLPFVTVGVDSIIFLAPGTYKATTLKVTEGKIYGGFSGNESVIELNNRNLMDKDGNGIVEPWEFSNEAIIIPFNSNYYFTESGVTNGGRLLIVSGTNGEVNGVTLTNFNYQGNYTGPISLGVPSQNPLVTNNTADKAGVLRFCIVKKIKTTNTVSPFFTGIIMSTNKFSIIDRCLIENNVMESPNAGGTVFFNKFGGKVTGSVIRNNSSANGSGRGGAVYATSNTNTDMDAIVENCVIYNNYAGGNGGAIRSEAQSGKRGIQIVNSTIVNNQTGGASPASSVELITSGLVVNSIISGDQAAELRTHNANNYILTSGFDELATGSAAINGSGNVTGSGVNVAAFDFTNPTDFIGVMIPDFTLPFEQANYDQIQKANFTIKTTASLAVTTIGSKVIPASYTYATTTITNSASIPTLDILGYERPINTSTNLDLGAYQFSDKTTDVIANQIGLNNDITSVNGGIIIRNANYKSIAICNISGQLIKQNIISSGQDTQIKLNRGAYIVLLDNCPFKVLVR